MSKFIFIHPSFAKLVSVGATVAHNGDNGRQGWVGDVVKIDNASVLIYFKEKQLTQSYSLSWFSRNFYIETSSVPSSSIFCRAPFIKKYAAYQVTLTELKASKRISHEYAKQEIDEQLRLEREANREAKRAAKLKAQEEFKAKEEQERKAEAVKALADKLREVLGVSSEGEGELYSFDNWILGIERVRKDELRSGELTPLYLEKFSLPEMHLKDMELLQSLTSTKVVPDVTMEAEEKSDFSSVDEHIHFEARENGRIIYTGLNMETLIDKCKSRVDRTHRPLTIHRCISAKMGVVS